MSYANVEMVAFSLFWLFVFFFVLGPCLECTQLFEGTSHEKCRDEYNRKQECSAVRVVLSNAMRDTLTESNNSV